MRPAFDYNAERFRVHRLLAIATLLTEKAAPIREAINLFVATKKIGIMTYKHMSTEERRLIYQWRREGCGVRKISKLLGR